MAKLQAAGKTPAAALCYPFLAFVFNLAKPHASGRPSDTPGLENYSLEDAQKISDAMPTPGSSARCVV